MTHRARATPRRLSLSLALTLGIGLGASPAHAQSSYTVSTLKPSASAKSFWPQCINDKDEVLGQADYYKKTVFSWQAPGFVTLYDPYAVKWAATTSSTVSPTKVSTYVGNSQYSPTCTRVMVGSRLIDTATGKVTATLPGQFYWGPPTDTGSMVVMWDLDTANIWTPAGGIQPLSVGSYRRAPGVLTSLNNAGDVAGGVVFDDRGSLLPAVWRGGTQLQILTPGFGDSSRAASINAAGQVLMSTFVISGDADHFVASDALALWDQGALTPLLAKGDARSLGGGLLNNKGVVMGCLGDTGVTGCAFADTRAVIWQNGVLNDLTSHVNARGAKLPLGSVLTRVFALNDKGSFVAELRSASRQFSTVRLTAKP